MNDIKKFVAQWSGRGYEKGETHSFWLSFLRDVLGISEPEKFIQFEVPVKLKHTSFIDAFLPDTKVIIEQASSTLRQFFALFHASALDYCLQLRSVSDLRHGNARRSD